MTSLSFIHRTGRQGGTPRRTRGVRRLRSPLALVSAAALLLLSLWGSSATYASTPFVPPGKGYLDFSYAGVTVGGPTGEKPESKLWWNDGFWWGSLYNSAGVGRDSAVGTYQIYRLIWGTQTWESTGVALDERENSKADTLWDAVNFKLYVASHEFTASSSRNSNDAHKGRLYRFTYNPATQSYSLDDLDGGGPNSYVLVNDDQTETLVLDKDTGGTVGLDDGRLWTTFVSRPGPTDHQVYVNATTAGGLANDGSWPTDAFSLGSIFPEAHVMTDDISSLVAFQTSAGGNGKIGIMWSNQLSNTVTFAVHNDSNSSFTTVSDWTLTTIPITVTLASDDHISLKSLQATSQGQVFAAVKTNATNPADPVIVLVARDTNGTLSVHNYSTRADADTRPVVLVDQTANKVYVFVTGKTGGSKICQKSLLITSPLSAMGDFLPGNCGADFIVDGTIDRIDDATTTKRPVDSTTGIVILASDDVNGKFYVHGFLGDPPPVVTARTPGFDATSVPVTSTISATFSKPMNASTLTTTNFTVANGDGPATGTVTYNATTRTATFTPNTLLRANSPYTVTVSGGIQDASGQALFASVSNVWSFTTEAPKVQFSGTAYSVSEGAGTATITVTLNVSSTMPVTVNYATSNGTATAPSDYTAASGPVPPIPAGQTSGTFTVLITNDGADEGNETVNLTLSSPGNASPGTPMTSTLTIVDDDGTPSVQFDLASFSANEGAGNTPITVTLSNPSDTSLTVDYTTTISGTATAVNDYTPTGGTLTFAALQTSRTFTVTLVNDSLDEPDETVVMELSNPSPAISVTLGLPSVAALTILDNNDPPTVQFSAGSFSVNEGSSTATITATLSAQSEFMVTVGYSTSDFTALAPSDYGAASGTLTFAPLQTSRTFTVTIVPDALDEADEIVNLALSNPDHATLGATGAAALTIVDDDPTPTVQFSISAYSWGENQGTVTITVTLSAPSGQSVSVDYATSNGTATAGSDYNSEAGTLDFDFALGVTTQTFTVKILDDTAVEGNETVILTLSNPDDATLGAPSTAVLTIVEFRIYLPLIMR